MDLNRVDYRTILFVGQIHTLLMVDGDVPYPIYATDDKPLIHMMVINMEPGDLNTGKTLMPYRGPAPPDASPHTYYFLLYNQQTGSLDIEDTSAYTENCER